MFIIEKFSFEYDEWYPVALYNEKLSVYKYIKDIETSSVGFGEGTSNIVINSVPVEATYYDVPIKNLDDGDWYTDMYRVIEMIPV